MKAKIDFSAMLNLSIEDMKSSLGVLLHGIEVMGGQPASMDNPKLSPRDLQYEIARTSGNLNKIQDLYQILQGQCRVSLTPVSLFDFLQDQVLKSTPYLDGRGVSLSVHCDENLNWFLDSSLIANLLGVVVANAVRYSQSQVVLKADVLENGFLRIGIEDDGRGYPSGLVSENVCESWSSEDFMQWGRLGIMIYYAAEIAAMHHNQGRKGFVRCRNGADLGGAVFNLYLP